jgi:hypothetical protein
MCIMNLIQRVKAPTPKFFKVLRTIGLTMAAVSAAVLAAPVALPAAVLTIAGYIGVAGTVMTAVSQTAVEDEAKRTPSGTGSNGGGSPSTGEL